MRNRLRALHVEPQEGTAEKAANRSCNPLYGNLRVKNPVNYSKKYKNGQTTS
jgi:hypothetical protein